MSASVTQIACDCAADCWAVTEGREKLARNNCDFAVPVALAQLETAGNLLKQRGPEHVPERCAFSHWAKRKQNLLSLKSTPKQRALYVDLTTVEVGTALPNGNDLDAISQLNNQFTGANFDAIRKYVASSGDDFLWGSNKIFRASYRLNVWPTAGTKPRKRWFAFLRILSRKSGRYKRRAQESCPERYRKRNRSSFLGTV